MSIAAIQLIASGLMFMITVLAGLWLSKMGRPLNVLIFTIHKLIALGSVILAGLAIYELALLSPMGRLQTGAIVVSAALYVMLFVTGALLSAEKPVNSLLLTLHKFGPLLAAICTGGAIYLLAGV